MKKFLAVAVAAGFIAAPAFAATISISFAGDDGTTQEWSFDDSTMTAKTGDLTTTYTYDEATSTICADVPETGEVCATFEESNEAPTVGTVSAYTLSTGGGGTATVTAITE